MDHNRKYLKYKIKIAKLKNQISKGIKKYDIESTTNVMIGGNKNINIPKFIKKSSITEIKNKLT